MSNFKSAYELIFCSPPPLLPFRLHALYLFISALFPSVLNSRFFFLPPNAFCFCCAFFCLFLFIFCPDFVSRHWIFRVFLDEIVLSETGGSQGESFHFGTKMPQLLFSSTFYWSTLSDITKPFPLSGVLGRVLYSKFFLIFLNLKKNSLNGRSG